MAGQEGVSETDQLGVRAVGRSGTCRMYLSVVLRGLEDRCLDTLEGTNILRQNN